VLQVVDTTRCTGYEISGDIYEYAQIPVLYVSGSVFYDLHIGGQIEISRGLRGYELA
jgi:hypothetical protein